jgi:DNA modification methylase
VELAEGNDIGGGIEDYTDQVICGDCAELLQQMPEACIDLVVTSPPYGDLREYKGFTFDFESIAKGLYRVLKPGGVIVWVVADETIDGSESGESFRQALYFKSLGLNLHDTMIYEKNGIRFPRPNAYYNTWEFMFVFSKGRPKTFHPIKDRKNNPENASSSERPRKHFKREKDGSFKPRRAYRPLEYGVRFNVWRYEVGGAKSSKDPLVVNHPAVFPDALARDHILSWSNPGDLVLDPMVGSGTTAVMAIETGRHFIGFDISQEYVDLAKRRVAHARRPLFLGETPSP